ncbi:MAG: Uma2 family endonuclease [Acidobacteria bacterium]|nr:Uma2 family endonuclease [Acidobacteriota bacterium]
MALKARTRKLYSPEEYLASEEKAERRSEFDGGVVTAMAGGSLKHASVISNLVRVIGNRLGNGCGAYASDLRVHVENFRKFYYPDVLVICGPAVFYENRNDTVTNPVLIIEVLSAKTEAKDRGEKMLAYRSLGSLREYVLISQTNPIVEQYTKSADGSWIHKATIGVKSIVKFESVEVELSLEDIYQRIEFSANNL